MKLLIFTQKVDPTDPVLGFFCNWLVSFAAQTESITVVCLEQSVDGGDIQNLPKNVTVYSLGKSKDTKLSKLEYAVNFYSYLRTISGTYDRVFVHMNQEYVLLGGLYWKLKHIPVYFWRNHPRGSLLTRMAVGLSTKVFYTSPSSFTAQCAHSEIMPAGIDTAVFVAVPGVTRKKFSVCVVGRIAPIKHVDLALRATKWYIARGGQVSLTILGDFLAKDAGYYDSLKKFVEDNDLLLYVTFLPAVSPEKLPEIYSSHEVCLNLTESGSFDKTIVEAAACGAMPLVSNQSLTDILPPACLTTADPEQIADALKNIFDPHTQVELAPALAAFVDSQSLTKLTEKLFVEMR